MRRRPFRGIVAVLLLAAAVAGNVDLERRHRRRPPEHSLYLPSGAQLRWVALGNRALLADLLYVWSIQYYSTDRADRWRWLAQLYDVISDLDPRFEAAYTIGALILSLEAGDTRAALRLLERGIGRNPGRYVLPWEAAFYARSLGMHERAAELFLQASRCPDAPDYVRRHFGQMLVILGRRDQALLLWQEIQATARSDYEREVARRRIDQIRLEMAVEETRRRVEEFRARRGRLPRSLDELVAHRLLGAVPLDAAGRPFRYDPATGTVTAEVGFLASQRVTR